MKFLINVSIIILSSFLHGKFLDLPEDRNSNFTIDDENPGFILPNENIPELAMTIWRKSKVGGIYISLGTERSFIGAAMSNVNFLLMVDRDPSVVAYNRMIIELLKLSSSGEDFFLMRTNWDYLCKKVDDLTEKKIQDLNLDIKHIKTMERCKRWQGFVKHSAYQYDEKLTHWLWRIDKPRQAQYWRNENLFRKLKNMADSGSMQAECLDLKDHSALKILEQKMLEANLKVSVLDFSNSHESKYIGSKGVSEVVKLFNQVLEDDTILLFTWVQFENYEFFTEYCGFYVKDFSVEVFTNFSVFQSQAINNFYEEEKFGFLSPIKRRTRQAKSSSFHDSSRTFLGSSILVVTAVTFFLVSKWQLTKAVS